MSQIRMKHIAHLSTATVDETPRPVIALENIESGTGRLLPGADLTDAVPPRPGMADVGVGHVLFGKLRPYLAKSWVADRSVRASTELLCLRPQKGTDSRWLGYVVASIPFIDWAIATSDGTKMPRTSWDQLREFRTAVPPLAEQRAIASYLDCETARIHALVAAKRHMVDLLRDRLVAARRLSLDEAMAESKGGALRWLVTCLDSRRIPLNREERALRSGPYPYWGAGSVVDSIDSYLFDEELVLLGEDGAPFFDDSRDVAFRTEGRIWVNNHIHVLRCEPEMDARWLRHMLNAVDYSAYISGSTRDKLTQDEMMEIRIPMLDLESQIRVRDDLDSIERKTLELSQRITRQLVLLDEHRRALITAAVTGQLDVPEVA